MNMTLTDKEADEFYEWFLDMYGRKRHAAELAESKKRGFERGFKKEKREDALNMLKKKYSLDEISEITDLSKEEILQIAKDNDLVIL